MQSFSCNDPRHINLVEVRKIPGDLQWVALISSLFATLGPTASKKYQPDGRWNIDARLVARSREREENSSAVIYCINDGKIEETTWDRLFAAEFNKKWLILIFSKTCIKFSVIYAMGIIGTVNGDLDVLDSSHPRSIHVFRSGEKKGREPPTTDLLRTRGDE